MVYQGVPDLVKDYFSLAMNPTEILQSLVHLNNVIVLSMRTLRRVLKSAALYRHKEYSDILDVSIYLMELLRNSNKSNGYKFVHLNCIQKGFDIRQETVRLLLQIVDPAGVEHRRSRRDVCISTKGQMCVGIWIRTTNWREGGGRGGREAGRGGEGGREGGREEGREGGR